MKRVGAEWSAVRFGLAVFGWFIVTFAPLNKAVVGQISLWGKHPGDHLFFVMVGLAFFALAVEASMEGVQARLALLATAVVLVLGGLAVSVTAFVPYLPFIVLMLLARVATRRRVAVTPAAAV